MESSDNDNDMNTRGKTVAAVTGRSPSRKLIKSGNFATSESPNSTAQTTTRRSPRKPIRPSNSADSIHLTDWWEIEETLEEAIIQGVRQYLVRWVGVDPETGKQWEDSWIEGLNDDALQAWEEKKSILRKRKAREGEASVSPSVTSSPVTSRRTRDRKPLASKRSRRKIIDSSSPSSEADCERDTASESLYQQPVHNVGEDNNAHRISPHVAIPVLPDTEKDLYRVINSSQIPLTPGWSGTEDLDIPFESPDSPCQHLTFSEEFVVEPTSSSTQKSLPHQRRKVIPDSQSLQETQTLVEPRVPGRGPLLSATTPFPGREVRKQTLSTNNSGVERHQKSQTRSQLSRPGASQNSQTSTSNSVESRFESQIQYIHSGRPLDSSAASKSTKPSIRHRPTTPKPPTSLSDLHLPEAHSGNISTTGAQSLSLLTSSQQNEAAGSASARQESLSAKTSNSLNRTPQTTSSLENISPNSPSPFSCSRHSMSSGKASSAMRARKLADIWRNPNDHEANLPSAPGGRGSNVSASMTQLGSPMRSPGLPSMSVETAAPHAMETASSNQAAYIANSLGSQIQDQRETQKGSEDLLKGDIPVSHQNIFIPLPLQPSSAELYQSVLRFRGNSSNAGDVLQQLMEVCQHPDLLNDRPATQAVGLDAQVEWAVTSSSKFWLLRVLFEFIQHANKKVVLVVKQSLLDISETFVRGLDISYTRPDRPEDDVTIASSQLTVTILQSGHEQVHLASPDLILGLDESFEFDAARSRFRPAASCPAVLLFVPDSAEHIVRQDAELDVPSILREAVQRSGKVGHAASLRKSHGGVPELAERLGLALLSNSGAAWELLQPRNVEFDDRKRPFESDADDSDVDRVKRVRIRDDPTMSTAESSRVDDSILSKASRELEELRIVKETLEKQLRDTKNLNAELETSFGNLQLRFEDQTKAHEALTRLYEACKTSLAGVEERLAKSTTANADLRAERATLREANAATERLLAESDHPDVKELAELRVKCQRVDSLEKKIKSMSKDSEYFRALYQSTLGEGADHRNESERLRSENDELKLKASGEAARLHQLHQNTASQRRAAELARLQAENRSLKRSLTNVAAEYKRFKEEAEREKERKGMGASTRSSSLPPSSLASRVPGPAAHKAASLLGGGSLAGALNAHGRRGVSSANASRAASPAAQSSVSVRTSPLLKVVQMNN